MCFSPEVDLATGAIVGVLAFDAIRHNTKRENLPLALFPAWLAVHSVIEAFVWFAGRGQIGPVVGDLAAIAYLAIAFVVVPIYLPYAVRAREPAGPRRTMLSGLLGVGVMVSAVLLVRLLTDRLNPELEPYYINYRVAVPAQAITVPLYVLATCGAGLLSSSRRIQVFGVVNFAMVTALAFMTANGMTSLWCAWATVTSLAIVLFVRQDGRSSVGTDDPVGRRV